MPAASKMPKSALKKTAKYQKAHLKRKDSDDWADDQGDLRTQASQASSDDGMMAAIAQHMKVSMQKKKKEKEAQFLKYAEKQLSQTLAAKAAEFREGTAEIDKIFADFQVAYAKVDDNIRRLWSEILEEQKKLTEFSRELHQRSQEREARREKKHIKALTHTRKACEDLQRLMDSLEPGNNDD